MDFTKRDQKIISIGSGMRGLERGIERAGVRIKPLCYVEVEAFIIWNLVKQMEAGVLDEAPIWVDVKTFPFERFRGLVDGIVSGYPCQPFSVAGKQKGVDDPRHLWPFIKEGIGAIRPIWCFFENVPGHINIGYREVRSDLEELGYRVEEGIFSAEEVGAPHQRKRLFILAILADTKSELRKQSGDSWEWRAGFANICFNEFVGDSYSNGIPSGLGDRRNKQNQGGFEAQQEERKRVWSESTSTSQNELAYTNGIRQRENSQEYETEQLSKNATPERDRWPSRPGEDQYEWEKPRTKSRMGFTVNGYNYREDLLRMAGNGVVSQTAELAFLSLLKKHEYEI